MALAWVGVVGFQPMAAHEARCHILLHVRVCLQRGSNGEPSLLADYPEWAWVNADDALVVLEWKGEQDDQTYADTISLRDRAAKKIDVDRLADLVVAQERAHKNMLSNETHAFNKWGVSTHPWALRAAWQGSKRPRIKERLP